MKPEKSEHAHSPTALLAEDDSLIRELVEGYLLQLGYHVTTAHNGQAAIQLLQEGDANPFDLIVTDLLMPKASGDALIAQARKVRACGRFLVMTGNSYDPHVSSYSDSDDAQYIEKPFTFGDFEEKLHRLKAVES